MVMDKIKTMPGDYCDKLMTDGFYIEGWSSRRGHHKFNEGQCKPHSGNSLIKSFGVRIKALQTSKNVYFILAGFEEE